MQLRSIALEPAVPRLRAVRLPRVAASTVFAFFLPFAVYLGLGAVLAFTFHSVPGDAWSRVGNAYYVLFSRDPHIGAIGFVWTPLPSILMMPLLPFGAIFPGLIREGYAAVVISAGAMAVAVWQVHGFLADLRVRRTTRWVLTALFALHPMILLYGANGMSEALFIASLVVTVRFVARWIDEPTTTSLVTAAGALAFAYLTRYEAVIAAAAAAGVVMVVAYRHATGTAAARRLATLSEVLVLLVPIGAAFFSWALASWIITGEPFPIFTSVYGNSAYVERAMSQNALATGQGTPAAVDYVADQIIGLQPLFVVVAAIAVAVALRRRDWRILAVGGILGAVLAFQVYAFLTGRTYGWLRFYITVIPMATMLVGLSLAEDGPPRAALSEGARLVARARHAFAGSGWPRVVAGGVLAGVLATAFAPSLLAMGDSRIGRGETAEQTNALFGRQGTGFYEQYSAEQARGAADIAGTLDAMGLAHGSVLVDSATAFPIIMQASDPKIFVITSDRDFESALADPAAFDVEYLLLPPDFQGHDALNRAYPTLYQNGTYFTELVRTFDAAGQSPDWRLYRVIGNT